MIKIIFFITVSLMYTLGVVKANDGATSGTTSLPSTTMIDLDRDILNALRECNETFRIEMPYLQALNETGNFPEETDKTPKCYLKCVIVKLAVMSEDGAFNAERAAQVLASNLIGSPDDQMEEFTRACADKNEACKCERSYSFIKCVKEKSIAKYKKHS